MTKIQLFLVIIIFCACNEAPRQTTKSVKSTGAPVTTKDQNDGVVCMPTQELEAATQSIVNTHCVSCHGASGQNPHLADIQQINANANWIYITTREKSMPPNAALSSDKLQTIKTWYEQFSNCQGK